ncbi:MAG: NPCBM/NEW2 domain-containing protein [Planctomycetes bacterium]|nr:NPCBM/NEW2 domain-containing protein [Planctomycetota bacterium]
MKNSPRSRNLAPASARATSAGRRRGRWLSRAACGVAFLGVSAVAVEVSAVRVDGTTITGEWAGYSDRAGLELRQNGTAQRVAVDELMSITFGHAAVTAHGTAVFHLADGGRLPGDLAGGAPDGLVTRSALGERVTIPFDRLAGVQLGDAEAFPRSAELFREALAERPAGHDILITRGTDDVKRLTGRLVSLDQERGSFVFADRERSFQRDRIFGVVLARGAGKPATYPLAAELADGSVVAGTIRAAAERSLHLETSVGYEVDLPLTSLRCLRYFNRRVVYLSDLPVLAERSEGLLHRGWPVRRDGSVAAGPLMMDGVHYEKGLGVHSRTELDYDLEGRFVSLVATVGLDDAVRPRGSVVFRVMGDGRVLFDSGPLTGADAPRPVVADVTSVKRMTLTVDYGDGLDLADHADWGGARLLRPASAVPTGDPSQ